MCLLARAWTHCTFDPNPPYQSSRAPEGPIINTTDILWHVVCFTNRLEGAKYDGRSRGQIQAVVKFVDFPTLRLVPAIGWVIIMWLQNLGLSEKKDLHSCSVCGILTSQTQLNQSNPIWSSKHPWFFTQNVEKLVSTKNSSFLHKSLASLHQFEIFSIFRAHHWPCGSGWG